ncbi:hypothetical protein AKJ65_02820 [candidate division MSBL1 archaeon SCGC-AAA259E19]|uniref:NAD/GMP synthase domain-containing protein n=1 Tax=candidate division MSBL1 archaeon SCGC-AAA259E19 TaxID=1698264 RepID=A0A133UL88_9EURY|nr:hypothetical protein AKJ65_02820 [candidate division MSBL1 archaeon SCGC-AAA259E19]
MEYTEKEKKLKEIVEKYGSAVVAFSGGADSFLVASIASEVLGDEAVAVTARSPIYPSWDEEDAEKVSEETGIRHIFLDSQELKNENFAENPEDRCYYCKKELLESLDEIRKRLGYEKILDGTNSSDFGDYRPGLRALREFGEVVQSPLAEAQLEKEDVRKIAEKRGLPIADKPSSPCLASRIPYGDRITPEKVKRVRDAEEYLRSLGFRIVRVRDHGNIARLEVAQERIPDLLERRKEVAKNLKDLGYDYVSLDLEGYRTGSLNPE